MVRLLENPRFKRGEPLPVRDAIPWDELIEGEEFGPLGYDIRPEVHQKHIDYYKYTYPFFNEEQHLFPWELWCDVRVQSRWKYGNMMGGNMRRIRYECHRPAKVGQTLIGTAMCAEKYHHREKPAVAFTCETRDLDGFLLFRGRHDVFWYWGVIDDEKETHQSDYSVIEKQRRSEKGWWTDVKPGNVQRATKDLDVGYVLPAVVRSPMPMRVSGFRRGGWDENRWIRSIHSDWAKLKGYQGGLSEANMITENGILQLLCDFFGPENYMNGGYWDVKCTGPGYENDVLVGKARIREKKLEPDGGVRYVLDIRIEKQLPDEPNALCQIGEASTVIH